MFEETFRKDDTKLNTERQAGVARDKEKGGKDMQGREKNLCKGPEAGRVTECL